MGVAVCCLAMERPNLCHLINNAEMEEVVMLSHGLQCMSLFRD